MNTSAAIVVKPLRIKRLSLCDFRGFPGPSAQTINLDGKNLLIYGENGSGKSSVFHALREFFSLKPAKKLADCRNVFSGVPEDVCRIEVEFDDGRLPAVWHTNIRIRLSGQNSTYDRHPSQVADGADQRVAQAALRRACLDYRALLDTNYLHGEDEINLFDIVVKYLVHDYPVATEGGEVKTVGELWANVLAAKPRKHIPKAIERVNQACASFNAGMNAALTALHPHVCTLLEDLIGDELVVSPFNYPGTTYQAWHFKRDRLFSGTEVKINVNFRTRPLSKPQLFLNEARLSALALAIYFAGRLACTPTVSSNTLKLLVLDDVLIGLDMANRIPVLDVLRKHFSDWQIILMTFDRTWFELVHMQTQGGGWQHVEMYCGHDIEKGFDRPVIRHINEGWTDLLSRARHHLAEHDHRAAAVYARAAFELWVKKYCQNNKVKVPYISNPARIEINDLWQEIKQQLKDNNIFTSHQQRINDLESYRRVVLNPFSHTQPIQITRVEIEQAIDAVQALEKIKTVATPTSPAQPVEPVPP